MSQQDKHLVYYRCLYPNWCRPEYFTQGWQFFFQEEVSNIGLLLAIWAGLSILLGCFTVGCLLKMFLVVVAFRRFWAGGICNSTADLTGKNAIVTGANIGIGKETARGLLKRGARVILACRNADRAEAARRELSEVSNLVEVRKLDTSCMKSVRAFAKTITDEDLKIHILVNNAGVFGMPYSENEDGFEMTMATNHLGPFLLTNLLLPQLQHGEPARIVNTSSMGHMSADIDFENLMMRKDKYWDMQAYSDSKLANILFTRQLAKILKGSNVSVFAVHPGVVVTNIFHRVSATQRVVNWLSPFVLKTSAQGAQTTLYCALEARQHPDMYFTDCAVGWPAPNATDDVAAQKLWDLSADLVKLHQSS